SMSIRVRSGETRPVLGSGPPHIAAKPASASLFISTERGSLWNWSFSFSISRMSAYLVTAQNGRKPSGSVQCTGSLARNWASMPWIFASSPKVTLETSALSKSVAIRSSRDAKRAHCPRVTRRKSSVGGDGTNTLLRRVVHFDFDPVPQKKDGRLDRRARAEQGLRRFGGGHPP